MSVHNFTVTTASGEDVSLGEYAGKVLLLVNTASKCGKTPQYEGLEQLHKDLADEGLLVIGFPCNQFGGQEPGTNDEIQEFCSLNFGVTFPVMAKIDVNGDSAHPLYAYLTEEHGGPIQWNFTKFLVDRDGTVVERFEPGETPEEITPVVRDLVDGGTPTI
jgi:glutathione peroxidase